MDINSAPLLADLFLVVSNRLHPWDIHGKRKEAKPIFEFHKKDDIHLLNNSTFGDFFLPLYSHCAWNKGYHSYGCFSFTR
jgi:hypothetical protein